MVEISKPQIGLSDVLICIILTFIVWWMGPAYITALDEIGWGIVAGVSFLAFLLIFHLFERFAGRDLSFDIVRLPFLLLLFPLWPLKYLDPKIEEQRESLANHVGAGWLIGGTIWAAAFFISFLALMPFPSECHEDNCVLVAGLQGDSPIGSRGAHARKSLKAAFDKIPGNHISVVEVPRSLFRVAWGNPEQARAVADWQAKFWHARLGSTVFLYGRVSNDGRTQEYHAVGRDGDVADLPLMLPHYFQPEYGAVLALFAARLGPEDGVYAQSVLWPLVRDLRSFVAKLPKNVTAETKAQILTCFADVSSHVGAATGNVEALEQTIWIDEMLLKRQIGDWAHVQSDLGQALSALGARMNGEQKRIDAERLLNEAKDESARGAALLAKAVGAYREALISHDAQSAKTQWATAQLRVGRALADLGKRLDALGNVTESKARLREAADAYGKALSVFTFKDAKKEWAAAQFGIGETLSHIGMHEDSDPGTLVDAAAAYRAALKVYDLASEPEKYAASQNALATDLLVLGKRGGDAAHLTGAIEAYGAALKGYSHNPEARCQVRENLGDALAARGAAGGGMTDFDAAAATYDTALKEVAKKEQLKRWAVLQNKLAEMLIESAKRDTGIDKLRKADAILSETVSVIESLNDGALQSRLAQNRTVVEKLRFERFKQAEAADGGPQDPAAAAGTPPPPR